MRDAIAPGGRIIRVRPLRGGISSSVHLLRLATANGQHQAVVVRRYGEYWQRTDPVACRREFRLLEVLADSSFPAPKPLLLEAEAGPFDAPTVVMSHLPGRPLLAPRNLPDYLQQMAGTLAHLHQLPIDRLDFLPDQTAMVARVLGASRPSADDPLQQAVWDSAVAAWGPVAEPGGPRALVHGDYWPGNVLWKRGRLVGVVDWEQPRLGDPAKDVATCRGDLTILFGGVAADEFLMRYESASGRHIEHLRFWDLFISTWAVREIDEWAVVYPLLGRPDLTPDAARTRIRAFARAALDRSDEP
ncbi:MAG TPA: phosphotransferase [Chloroflexota bacterium]|nr:phosphotransferase [Chloroflexota bacterium]